MPLPQGSLYPTFQSILTFFWISTPHRRWKSQAIFRRQTYGDGLSYNLRDTLGLLYPLFRFLTKYRLPFQALSFPIGPEYNVSTHQWMWEEKYNIHFIFSSGVYLASLAFYSIPFYHTQPFRVIVPKSYFHHSFLLKNICGVPLLYDIFWLSRLSRAWPNLESVGCGGKRIMSRSLVYQWFQFSSDTYVILSWLLHIFLIQFLSSVEQRYNPYLIALFGGIIVATVFKELQCLAVR